MAFSRAVLYEQQLQQCALYAKAISHPEGIAIIKLLKKNGTSSVNRIAMNSPLHLNTVSQHLSILRKTGLVTYEEKFPHIYYSINEEVFNVASVTLLDFFSQFNPIDTYRISLQSIAWPTSPPSPPSSNIYPERQ